MENSPELELCLRFLQPQIQQILRNNRLSREAHVIPYVVNNPFYPGFDTPQNMLCVILHCGEQLSRRFKPTKYELLALIQSHNINDVHVEIRDIDLNFSASLSAIPPNHPIVTIYGMSNMRPSTFYARIYPPSGVFSLSSDELVPIKPGDQVYYPQQSGQSLDLHFFPWDIPFLKSPGVSFLNRMDTPWMPAMGDSLGLRGDDNAGTLGGYVTWLQDEKKIKCALTNYHVVRSREELMETSGKSVLELDQSGASPTSRPGINITVESFADVDRQASLAQADNTMKGLCHQLSITQENIIKRESSGMDPLPHHLDILKNNQETFERLEQKRSILEAMPKKKKKIGEVSHEQISFADNGDSDSFVLDHKARVCGLFYGGVTGFFDRNRSFANAGLVMNMPDLTESMKLETMIRNGNGQVCSVGILGLPDYERS